MLLQDESITPQYLDYLTIASRTIDKKAYHVAQLSQTIIKVYHRAATLMSEPEVLNNPHLLAQFDKHHIGLYEADRESFFGKPDFLNTHHIK